MKQDAVSPIIGVLLLVAITVTLGATLYFLVPSGDVEELERSTIRLTDRDGQYLEPVGGNPLDANETVVRLQTANGVEERTLFELGVGDTWDAGERICLVGAGTGCIFPPGTQLERAVVVGGNQVLNTFTADSLQGSGVEATPKPDLLVEYVSSSPTPKKGETTDFVFRVSNAGNADAAAFDTTFSLDGILIATENHGSLAAGADVSVTVSAETTEDLHQWYVVTDAGGDVDESNEANNAARHSYAPEEELEDLSGAFVSVSPTPKENRDSDFAFRIATTGTVGAFQVQFIMDGSAVETQTVNGIPEGNTADVTLTWNGAPGNHALILRIDSGGAIPESDEANNDVQYDFSVAADVPDFTVVETEHSNGVRAMDAGDLDLDGDIDLVLSDTGSRLRSYIWEDGAFEEAHDKSIGVFSYDVVIADLYESLYPEVVSIPLTSQPRIYSMNDKAEFKDQKKLGDPAYHAKQVAVADIDGDTQLDLVVAFTESNSKGDGGLFYKLQEADGKFNDKVGDWIRIDDENTPGEADIVASLRFPSAYDIFFEGADQTDGAQHLKNDGSWTATTVSGEFCSTNVGPVPWGAESGDLNGDGFPDVVNGCRNSNYGCLYTMIWDGSKYDSSRLISCNQLAEGSGDIWNPKIADLDQDGDLDIIAGDTKGHVYFFEQTSSLVFEMRSVDLEKDGFTPQISDVVVFNLDGDARLEIVASAFNTSDLYIVDSLFEG